ncbi:MAG: hypothetical protein WC378_09010 [Opitutaceae bacterium]|jgi:hypothetical protein
MQPLRLFLTAFLLTVTWCRAETLTEAPGQPVVRASDQERFRFVDIPVCKTSIYVGSVTLATGRFERQGDRYLADYKASVFPFFFYREKGALVIRVDSESLSRLAKGEKIRIEGTATTSSGDVRRIEGTATPSDIHSGKLKIAVHVSRAINLAFTTSYRFADCSPTCASPSSRTPCVRREKEASE